MSDIQTLYAQLLSKLAEMANLGAAMAALDWDEQVLMPQAGEESRAKVAACLAGIAHDKAVAPDFEEILRRLVEESDRRNLETIQTAIVQRAFKDFEREKKLPGEFVRELAELRSASHHVWARARKESNFQAFLPNLEKIILLKRQEAQMVGFEGTPYNALLDSFESDATVEKISRIFLPLQEYLQSLVRKIKNSSEWSKPRPAPMPVSKELQAWFNRYVATTIGFDFGAGRLDISAHPFTQRIHPGDTRITTRYDENNFLDSLTSVTHEAGHGMYEQALLTKHFGTAAGGIYSLGMHESQSRLWENIVGRSRPFWQFFLPKARQAGLPINADLNTLYRAINTVTPSLIRVEADEVTYNLHICLRFNLERDLIEGRLEARDLQAAWNAGMKKFLDIEVPNDEKGVLQDVHWSAGLFGYFPTYALGNLYSAQLYAAAKNDIPRLTADFRRGNFSKLNEWLKNRIYRFASILPADRLVRLATGVKPSASYFIDYIDKKYGELYHL